MGQSFTFDFAMLFLTSKYLRYETDHIFFGDDAGNSM